MNNFRLNVISFAAFLVTSMLALPVHATPAGSVIFTRGPVTAEREPPIALAKGDDVLVADTVATGEAGRAQLLMLDGAKISIRPNSRLKIEEYSYTEPGSAATRATIATVKDSSVTSLIKGGFRNITGAIGKADATDYEVRTPVGVLGIRGTDYTAVLCNADCDWAPGANANEPLEDGLYLGVMDGTIFFRNELGEFDISAGEYVFIAMSDRVLRQLTAPPGIFLDSYDVVLKEEEQAGRTGAEQKVPLRFDGKLGVRRDPGKPGLDEDGNEKSDQERQENPEQPVMGIDADGSLIDITPGSAPQRSNQIIGFSVGPLGAQGVAFSAAQENSPGEVQLDALNNVLGFSGSYPSASANEAGQYAIGSSALTDTGFDSLTVLRWGRWTGGTVNIQLNSGTDASQPLTNQSLHWITSTDNAVPVMPITGTATYSLVGGTSPTDNFGNVGVLGSASFSADFLRQFVTSDLTIFLAGSTWNASGTGSMGAVANPALAPYLFVGSYGNVSVDGVAGGSGVFSGFFSAPGPSSVPGAPGGVGLTYSLLDEPGITSVTGAAAFGNPQ